MIRVDSLVAALFSLAAMLQFNDPDPIRWVAIYGSAAVLSLLPATRWRRLTAVAAPLLSLGALLWAAAIARRGVSGQAVLEMFSAWEMRSAEIEAAREMSGLLLIAAWMTVLTIRRRRQH